MLKGLCDILKHFKKYNALNKRAQILYFYLNEPYSIAWCTYILSAVTLVELKSHDHITISSKLLCKSLAYFIILKFLLL